MFNDLLIVCSYVLASLTGWLVTMRYIVTDSMTTLDSIAMVLAIALGTTAFIAQIKERLARHMHDQNRID